MEELTEVVAALDVLLAVDLVQHRADGDQLVCVGHDLVPGDDILIRNHRVQVSAHCDPLSFSLHIRRPTAGQARRGRGLRTL